MEPRDHKRVNILSEKRIQKEEIQQIIEFLKNSAQVHLLEEILCSVYSML
jgi:hypothetical protein